MNNERFMPSDAELEPVPGIVNAYEVDGVWGYGIRWAGRVFFVGEDDSVKSGFNDSSENAKALAAFKRFAETEDGKGDILKAREKFERDEAGDVAEDE